MTFKHTRSMKFILFVVSLLSLNHMIEVASQVNKTHLSCFGFHMPSNKKFIKTKEPYTIIEKPSKGETPFSCPSSPMVSPSNPRRSSWKRTNFHTIISPLRELYPKKSKKGISSKDTETEDSPQHSKSLPASPLNSHQVYRDVPPSNKRVATNDPIRHSTHRRRLISFLREKSPPESPPRSESTPSPDLKSSLHQKSPQRSESPPRPESPPSSRLGSPPHPKSPSSLHPESPSRLASPKLAFLPTRSEEDLENRRNARRIRKLKKLRRKIRREMKHIKGNIGLLEDLKTHLVQSPASPSSSRPKSPVSENPDNQNPRPKNHDNQNVTEQHYFTDLTTRDIENIRTGFRKHFDGVQRNLDDLEEGLIKLKEKRESETQKLSP